MVYGYVFQPAASSLFFVPLLSLLFASLPSSSSLSLSPPVPSLLSSFVVGTTDVPEISGPGKQGSSPSVCWTVGTWERWPQRFLGLSRWPQLHGLHLLEVHRDLAMVKEKEFDVEARSVQGETGEQWVKKDVRDGLPETWQRDVDLLYFTLVDCGAVPMGSWSSSGHSKQFLAVSGLAISCLDSTRQPARCSIASCMAYVRQGRRKHKYRGQLKNSLYPQRRSHHRTTQLSKDPTRDESGKDGFFS